MHQYSMQSRSCRRVGIIAPYVLAALFLSQNIQLASTKPPTENRIQLSTLSTSIDNPTTMGGLSTPFKTTSTKEDHAAHDTPASTLDFLESLRQKYNHQPTFLQAVEEMALSLSDLMEDPFYRRAFEVMTEPERTISFRVPWMDDQGHMHYNRGWRVEFSRYVCMTIYHYSMAVVFVSFR